MTSMPLFPDLAPTLSKRLHRYARRDKSAVAFPRCNSTPLGRFGVPLDPFDDIAEMEHEEMVGLSPGHDVGVPSWAAGPLALVVLALGTRRLDHHEAGRRPDQQPAGLDSGVGGEPR